jgi:hypothetical protein
VIAFLMLHLCLVSTGQVQSLEGKIRISGSSYRPLVTLVHDNKVHSLDGPWLDELGRLQSIGVKVSGHFRENVFVVNDYQITDIGGGKRPLVGYLAEQNGDLVLVDGEGTPIVLSAGSRTKRRLKGNLHAKLWIYGKQLLSGALKIRRYGLLGLKPAPDSDLEVKTDAVPEKQTPQAKPGADNPP